MVARELIWKSIAYILLTIVGVALTLPFLWAVSTSLKPTGQEFVFPPQWIPDPIRWDNYGRALATLPFGRFLLNTLFVTVTCVVGEVLMSTLTGFAFARLRFPGRDLLFALCLATLMLPYAVTLIPEFMLFRTFGWVDTFLPLIVPVWFGGGSFSIFLSRQYFMSLPLEYDDAARIDGVSEWGLYARILLPMSRPLIATIIIFSFVNHWNDYMRPLIYLNSLENKTISVGLRTFVGYEGTEWNQLMAASVATTIPVLLLFFAAQKYFVRGVVMSGITGR